MGSFDGEIQHGTQITPAQVHTLYDIGKECFHDLVGPVKAAVYSMAGKHKLVAEHHEGPVSPSAGGSKAQGLKTLG